MRIRSITAATLLCAPFVAAGPAAAQTAEPRLSTDSFASGLATGATLAPGTMTVRLRSELRVELSYNTDSASRTAGGKNSGVLLGSFARLYPKFDAKAANGLEYGATLEIRMNSGGVGGTGGNTLYFRRYNGYVGTPTVGRFYFGPENNALARLSAGTTMEDFDYTGGFNGDVPLGSDSTVAINYPFLRSSQFYTTNKLVYLSPAYAGFTLGAGWEPSQSTGDAQATTASTLNAQTSSLAGGSSLRRNTFDVAAQYKGSFGPVALTSFVGYIQSGHVTDNAATAATAQYRDLKAFAAGARVTFHAFSVGGNINTGDINGNGNGGLIRQGQRKGTNILVGAQYIVGPVIVGFHYVNELTGGFYNSNPTFTRSQLHDTGVVIGGAWDWAPGATLFTSALYSQRHQFGTNFVAGTTNTATGNSAQVRTLLVGQAFKW